MFLCIPNFILIYWNVNCTHITHIKYVYIYIKTLIWFRTTAWCCFYVRIVLVCLGQQFVTVCDCLFSSGSCAVMVWRCRWCWAAQPSACVWRTQWSWRRLHPAGWASRTLSSQGTYSAPFLKKTNKTKQKTPLQLQ